MASHCLPSTPSSVQAKDAHRSGARGFDYYSLKDRAMAEAAEYGLMLWDGKSKTFEDLRDLLAQGDSDSVERIVSELHVEPHRAAG